MGKKGCPENPNAHFIGERGVLHAPNSEAHAAKASGDDPNKKDKRQQTPFHSLENIFIGDV
jgi:hypothetical protein